MKKILHIAWNDIKIEFSDRSTLVFFLILPLVFTSVLGTALNGGNSSGGDNRVPVALVDADGTALSQRLVTVLSASTVVRAIPATTAKGDELLAEESVAAVLTVPAGFAAGLLGGQQVAIRLRSAPNDTQALLVSEEVRAATAQLGNAITVALVSVAEAEKVRPFANTAARDAYLEQGLALASEILAQPPARIETTRAPETNPQTAEGNEQSSPGQLVTWVLITLIGAAEVFVNERLGGTLRRLVVMPIRKATILIGKITGRMALGLIQMALLIGFGAFALGVNWGRSPLALVLVLVSFGLSAVALGVLLATFAKTRSQAAGLTVLFSMLTAALGGAWWPMEVTPPAYQAAVKVLPTTWAMRSLTDVIVRGVGVSGVLTEVVVLLGFAAVFLTVGIWRFRYE